MQFLAPVGQLAQLDRVVELPIGHEGTVGAPLPIYVDDLEERSVDGLAVEEDALGLLGVPSVLAEPVSYTHLTLQTNREV